MLETFTHIQEAQLAARIAKEFSVPVFVSVTVSKEGETEKGRKLEQLIQTLESDDNVDGIGLNCGVGPAAAYSNAERALPHTTKPFVIMANAGLPQEVDGRMIYMASPEYFTEYAKRMIELGVRGVGGCCGTTPADISIMAKNIITPTYPTPYNARMLQSLYNIV
jgi:homocysteine S-methyltransferase